VDLSDEDMAEAVSARRSVSISRLFQESNKASLFEVGIRGEGFVQTFFLHEHEAGAVDETEVFILPGTEISPAMRVASTPICRTSTHSAVLIRFRSVMRLRRGTRSGLNSNAESSAKT
jgi:hypothetical protein